MKILLCVCIACFLCACRNEMYDQEKYEPLERSTLFSDQRSARPSIPDTVPRGQPRLDDALYTGRSNGKLVANIPIPITRQMLERGQERFDIYCSECHDRVGSGNGMIVQRGFPQPPSFHSDRLRNAPAGHYFDVMTHGFGAMYPYADRITPQDRWAIVAYIRALQRSQNARVADVPADRRKDLEP